MKNLSPQLIVNLITTPEELSILFGSLIDESLDKRGLSSSTGHEPPEELLTIQQLADFFQVSITTIHNWKNEGLLPYVKVKSRVRFKKSVVLALDEKRRKKSKY